MNNAALTMEIDTGAAVSLISRSTYESLFPDLPLTRPTVQLRTYTAQPIATVGQVRVSVGYQGYTDLHDLTVVEGMGPSLLGRGQRFGPHPGPADTRGGNPASLPPPHSVPYSVHDTVGRELDRLEEAGVLRKVPHAAWAASLVPVPKEDGTLQLCGDYKVTINPSLLVDQYPLPKPTDLMTCLTGGVCFSKLDLTAAYQQMPLDEEPAKLVVVNTHQGLYQYTRLSFGVASAPAVFQRAMDTILRGIPQVICFLDDILVTGHSVEEHHKHLEEVLLRLQEHGVRLKKEKFRFCVESVEYLGLRIDAKEVHTTDRKVQTIIQTPSPKNISKLRSFLGMISYYASSPLTSTPYTNPACGSKVEVVRRV